MDDLYPCYTDVPGGYRIYWHNAKELDAWMVRRARRRAATKLGITEDKMSHKQWQQYCQSIGCTTDGKKLTT